MERVHDDERQLPPFGAEDERILESAYRRWIGDEELDRGPLFPFDDPEPPWVLAQPFSVPGDPAVIAAVVAVSMVAPKKQGGQEPWLVRALLRESSGPPTLDRVTIEHLRDASIEPNGTVLRWLALAQIRKRARARLRTAAAIRETFEDYFGPAEVEWARRAAAAALKKPQRRGRGGYDDDFYRAVALRAIELDADGRRDVVKTMQEEESERLGGRYVAYDTIKRRIGRARSEELGFLAPTTRGKANFAPGPNLYRKDQDDG